MARPYRLIACILCFVLGLLLGKLLYAADINHQPVWWLVFTAVSWIALGLSVLHSTRAGVVLMDLSQQTKSRALAVVIGVTGIAASWYLFSKNDTVIALCFMSLAFLFCMLILIYQGRVQVREQGITKGIQTVSWHRIRSYSLSAEREVSGTLEVTSHAVLSIDFNPYVPLWPSMTDSVTLRCPIGKSAALGALMEEHAPNMRHNWEKLQHPSNHS